MLKELDISLVTLLVNSMLGLLISAALSTPTVLVKIVPTTNQERSSQSVKNFKINLKP